MAFGTQLGFKTGSATSISTSFAIATGTSFAVALNDLVYVVVAEQVASGNGTCTTCTDNLGNVYTQTGTQLGSGTVACKSWYCIIKNFPGTITGFTVVANGGTSNACGIGVGIGGPFNAIDQNPAKITSDVTSRFTCPSTGTLNFADEVIVAFGAANYGTTWTAFAPNIIVTNAVTSTLAKCAIGIQTVAVTTAVAPEFAAAANPGNAVLGTTSFSSADTTHQGRAASFSNPSLYRPLRPIQDWFQSPAVPVPTVQSPFAQDDWPLPIPARRGPDWIYSTPIRLIGKDYYTPKTDWPVTRAKVPGQDWIYSTPINLIGKDYYVRQHWPNPLRVRPQLYGWTQSKTLDAPFAQRDWANPQRPPLPPPGWIDFDRFVVQVTTAPFAQYDWPLPLRPAVTPQGWSQSPAIPPPVTAAPFAQFDWPNPRRPIIVPQTWLQSPAVPPTPFAQYAWPNPQTRQVSPLGLVRPKTLDAPFAQFNWPVPQRPIIVPQGWLQSPQPVAVTAQLPFAQFDWPLSRPPRPQLFGGWIYATPINLIGKDVYPFRQQNWPVPPGARQPAQTGWIAYNVNAPAPPAPPTNVHFNPFLASVGRMKTIS